MPITTLKKLGNSKAIIIPARILKNNHVADNAPVYYEEKGDHLIIRFAPSPSGKTSAFFKELDEIEALPGPPMDLDEIRSSRNNKEDRTW